MEEGEKLPEGAMIGDYEIIKLIGQGGYGEIYSVKKSGEKKIYAMKVEELEAEKQGLRDEIEFLEKLQGCPSFPILYAHGETDEVRYLVMELYGTSLSNTRRQIKGHHFTDSTVARVGIFMLKCIRDFHKHGFIHRDIKPGNFLLRMDSKCPLVLIDFGLAKKYVDENNQLLPERTKAGFRGTSKYASLNAHNYKDLSRRDDLISWMYSLVELTNGCLIWSKAKDANVTRKIKMNTSESTLFENMPSQYIQIWRYINKLQFTDEPKYNFITDLLVSILVKKNIKLSDPYDWETVPKAKIEKVSPIGELPKASDMDPNGAIAIPQEKEADPQSSQCCLLI